MMMMMRTKVLVALFIYSFFFLYSNNFSSLQRLRHTTILCVWKSILLTHQYPLNICPLLLFKRNENNKHKKTFTTNKINCVLADDWWLLIDLLPDFFVRDNIIDACTESVHTTCLWLRCVWFSHSSIIVSRLFIRSFAYSVPSFLLIETWFVCCYL